jgi:hypothetical protein
LATIKQRIAAVLGIKRWHKPAPRTP